MLRSAVVGLAVLAVAFGTVVLQPVCLILFCVGLADDWQPALSILVVTAENDCECTISCTSGSVQKDVRNAIVFPSSG
jgi:hypothetical protein